MSSGENVRPYGNCLKKIDYFLKSRFQISFSDKTTKKYKRAQTT